jgi:hypothetical protein
MEEQERSIANSIKQIDEIYLKSENHLSKFNYSGLVEIEQILGVLIFKKAFG